MKKIILILGLLSLICSCQKENTTKPPEDIYKIPHARRSGEAPDSIQYQDLCYLYEEADDKVDFSLIYFTASW